MKNYYVWIFAAGWSPHLEILGLINTVSKSELLLKWPKELKQRTSTVAQPCKTNSVPNSLGILNIVVATKQKIITEGSDDTRRRNKQNKDQSVKYVYPPPLDLGTCHNRIICVAF